MILLAKVHGLDHHYHYLYSAEIGVKLIQEFLPDARNKNNYQKTG